jgi:hypothetical protein
MRPATRYGRVERVLVNKAVTAAARTMTTLRDSPSSIGSNVVTIEECSGLKMVTNLSGIDRVNEREIAT